MKKLLLSFSFFAVLLTGCSSPNNLSNTSINSNSINSGNVNTQDNKNKIIYTDSVAIEDDKIKMEFNKPSCYADSNYRLSISVDITNKEYKTVLYKIRNVELIKESTSANYKVSYSDSLSLEAEMKSTLYFSANIPSNIKSDKYKLTFSINSYNITYYPYETPDEFRANRAIKYHILNNVVKTDIVKDGRTISDAYTYESLDNLYYCNAWYLDSNYKTKLTSSTKIKEETNLYGVQSSNFKWMTTSSDAWSFVSGINHVPSNGILILPEKYLNKELAISNNAIRNISVSKIYIPKTMHRIYGGNFTGIGNATIYYEGSETEWKALFYSQSDVVTKNMVYNTKAPKYN